MENGAKRIHIATAKSRYELVWTNREVLFDELKTRLSKTKRTDETMEDFLKMPKKDQDKIKDIGGFVGGTLKQGRRKNGYVENRSLVTLDIDNGYERVEDDIGRFCTEAMIIYSTHKHTKKNPRLRVVIPLTREVNPDEYEAIARKIADDMCIGMDCFDDTTFEPARLMYWPSTPKDGEFYTETIAGEWTNPDAVLARYENWKDVSTWPTSTREAGKREHAGDKAGEPSEKPGVIGAFCRAYSIEEAIAAFIPDVYIPLENGRYTYANGSTAGGLIVYDDKFAYSNHSTDPAGGQLCNAFDLIRIHKFGELDINVASTEPISKRPSYKAMSDFAAKDSRVQELYQAEGKQRATNALEDFQGLIEEPKSEDKGEWDEILEEKKPEEPVSDDWMKEFHYAKNGTIIEDGQTALTIMENDPNLKKLVGLNAFKGLPELIRKAPWERAVSSGEYWTDADEAQLRIYLNKVYGLKNWAFIKDALSTVIEHNEFNPVKQYIEKTKWDGKPRVERLLIEYLGAEDNSYVRTVTRKMLVAAVARIYHPGIKFDYMVTLVGKQGLGKSLLIYKLGNGWTSDSLPDIRSKSAYEALDGVWLMEMGELVALKKTDRESIKLFISKTEDTYRKAYAHNTTVNKRTCIFIGTTNDRNFLNDSTGSRRFLVIDTDEKKVKEKVWNGLAPNEVAQIWAEAKVYFEQGEPIMDMPEDIHSLALSEQTKHSEDDPSVGIIGEFLEKEIPSDWANKTVDERIQWLRSTDEFKKELNPVTKIDVNGDEIKMVKRDRICAAEVWCECYRRDISGLSKLESRNINEALRALGWEQVDTPRKFGPYGSQRGFQRGATTNSQTTSEDSDL